MRRCEAVDRCSHGGARGRSGSLGALRELSYRIAVKETGQRSEAPARRWLEKGGKPSQRPPSTKLSATVHSDAEITHATVTGRTRNSIDGGDQSDTVGPKDLIRASLDGRISVQCVLCGKTSMEAKIDLFPLSPKCGICCCAFWHRSRRGADLSRGLPSMFAPASRRSK